MTKAAIIDTLARERRIERLVSNCARRSVLTQPMRDLAQDTYITLLKYPEPLITDLWDKGQINFFLVRIILNNLQGSRSQYYKRYIRFQRRSVPLEYEDGEPRM